MFGTVRIGVYIISSFVRAVTNIPALKFYAVISWPRSTSSHKKLCEKRMMKNMCEIRTLFFAKIETRKNQKFVFQIWTSHDITARDSAGSEHHNQTLYRSPARCSQNVRNLNIFREMPLSLSDMLLTLASSRITYFTWQLRNNSRNSCY